MCYNTLKCKKKIRNSYRAYCLLKLKNQKLIKLIITNKSIEVVERITLTC